MTLTPYGLVGSGRGARPGGPGVATAPVVGPDLAMRFGVLALADPASPGDLPSLQVSSFGGGTSATTSITVAPAGGGAAEPAPTTLAVAVGRLAEVTSWQRLIGSDTHVDLVTRSGLGAFYEITDTETLRPLLRDTRYMEGVRDRAAAGELVALTVDGTTVAVVFACPGGPGSYPAYEGYEVGMGAVAVLVDLQGPEGAVAGHGA